MPVIRDESRHPLVIETHSGAGTLDEVNDERAFLERLFAERKPVAFIFDLRNAEPPPMNVLLQTTKLSRDTRDHERAYCAGRAFVVENSLMRAVLMGAFMLEQPPAPVKVFTDMAAAEAWALDRLAERGAQRA
jgi:hypothetical protein